MKKHLLIVSLSMLLSPICFGQTAPTIAAPTPTVNSADVISIFSNAYTDLAGTNFDPAWGQATDATIVTIDGNSTYKLAGLNYQGINLGSADGTPQDFSAMKYLHLDIWSTNSTALNVYLINPGPVEKAFALTVPTSGWASVNIPLSAFSPTVDLSKVFQFKFDGNGTIFIDNIYFYTETVAPANDATLSDLKVDGSAIAGFSASTLSYNITLPIGTTVVPTINVTTTQVGASAVITPAASIPGTSTVVVTATDGTTIKTYSVNFTIAVPAVDLPVTFEDAILDYALTDFGGNSSEIVVDPIDATNTVAKSTKTVSAQTWAGTTVGGTIGFANKIPFLVGSTKMSVRVYSANAVGTHVRLKVEDASDPTKSVETEALTTVSNAWEFLVFDFTVPTVPPTAAINYSFTYNKASIFFNFGIDGATAGEQTYYWDDMYFGALYTGVKPLNASNNNVSVYPNPAENDLYFTSKTTLSKVAIYNTVGMQVKEYGNALKSINVSDLKTGVYMIRLTDITGKTVTSKFIKK